eukprot:190777-Rhodomonas_salina.2
MDRPIWHPLCVGSTSSPLRYHASASSISPSAAQLSPSRSYARTKPDSVNTAVSTGYGAE